MKRFVVGMAVVALAWPLMSWAQETQGVPPTQQPSRPMGAELAKGVVSPILSVPYFALKFSVGVTGAVLGGVSGFLTGGNERAAEGIWRPWTGGTYFITPEIIDGEKPFLPLNGGPYDPPRTRPMSSIPMMP